MTDDQLDERIRAGFANVELSPEAEDRILSNLLAAEYRSSDKGTGHLSEKPRKRGRVVRWAAPAAIAAALLVGVFVGRGLMPAYDAGGDPSMDGGMLAMGNAAEESAAEEPAVEESADSLDYAVRAVKVAEVIALEDGRRFAIEDVYEIPEGLDPGELDWHPATVESTGDPCEVSELEDGAVLVLFEGEDVLYRAVPLA